MLQKPYNTRVHTGFWAPSSQRHANKNQVKLVLYSLTAWEPKPGKIFQPSLDLKAHFHSRKKFPRTEKFVKCDWPTQIFRRKKVFEVENFQLLTMIFSENFLSVENFLDWKGANSFFEKTVVKLHLTGLIKDSFIQLLASYDHQGNQRRFEAKYILT